jgi:hypothetical protein
MPSRLLILMMCVPSRPRSGNELASDREVRWPWCPDAVFQLLGA